MNPDNLVFRIKKCCYFCVVRGVSCLGCVIAKGGLKSIKKKCQDRFKTGICMETFEDTVNKNLCFTMDDRDIEALEGKSTTKLSVGDKEEEPEKKEKDWPQADISKSEKEKKETKEDKTDKIAEALKEAAKKGDLDLKVLIEKLGNTR